MGEGSDPLRLGVPDAAWGMVKLTPEQQEMLGFQTGIIRDPPKEHMSIQDEAHFERSPDSQANSSSVSGSNSRSGTVNRPFQRPGRRSGRDFPS